MRSRTSFLAGDECAQDVQRTIFAVGDAKQSIFSFQGADLRSFGHYRGKFRDKVTATGARWLDGKLSVSFRSTAPVLGLTDAVFASGPARDGVCLPGEVLAPWREPGWPGGRGHALAADQNRGARPPARLGGAGCL